MFEDHPAYQDKVTRLIEHLDHIGCQIITSELTLSECLVKPYADKDGSSVELYQNNLQSSDYLYVAPVSRDVLILASQLRATLKNKMPDSIHVATAMQQKCDIFVGNDRQIRLPEAMRYIAL